MKAIIEMPQGDTIRRHFKFDKTGFIDLGPIKSVIPINDGIMPVNYGYIVGTLNSGEGDEIDVLIFSNNILSVGQEVEFEPIALISRADGDDKIVAVDKTVDFKSWFDIPKSERELIENFFSYHHEFKSIENADVARQYIEKGYKAFIL
ncbi:MAG: inorganic diphosphatase [Candidatus Falkowbacteria bacterium]